MKYRISIIIVSLFCTLISAQNLPEYPVYKITSSLTIDGILDDEEWDIADTTTHFVILGDAVNKPSLVTWAKALWDDDYLYIAFYCQDTNVWATTTDRDGSLYLEDVVEVYLDPDYDGEYYLEFELNPIETMFDLWLDKPWDEGGSGHSEFDFYDISVGSNVYGTVANTNDKDSAWTCEMALPFSEMSNVPQGGFQNPVVDDLWNFNLYRFDRNSVGDPEAEQTGWSQTSGGQHEPEHFGSILFTEVDTHTNAFIEQLQTNSDLSVLRNYPNPFSTSTTITYHVSRPGDYTLRVLDLSGRVVFTTRMNHSCMGEYSYKFMSDGLSTGTYFYNIQNEFGSSGVHKIVIIK
jgi:hypothetical protein